MNQYLKELGQYPHLTHDEEEALFLTRSYDQLIRSHLRMVVKLAYKHTYGPKLEDIIQEGNLGLMKAIENYQPKEGSDLSRFASIWILSYMRNYLARTKGSLTLPVRLKKEKVTEITLENADLYTDICTPEEALIDLDLKQQAKGKLKEFIKTLSDKEQYILNNRLLTEEAQGFQEIADHFGTSKQSVDQMEKRILKKLRNFTKDLL